MPRRIAFSLAFLAAAAGTVWAAWPGAPANPATLINRVDVIAAVLILAGLPWFARRVFGPAGGSRLARIVRAAGYATVFALVVAKAEVERAEYAAHSGRAWLAGAWVGEVVFLMVVAVYVAGLLAVTARRPPVTPVALAIGAGAGVLAGLLMYGLPPLGQRPHIAVGWLAAGYGLARIIALPLALGIIMAAGLAAARRVVRQPAQLPLADTRARRGVAAGLCAGAAAGLLFTVLSTGTVALLPHLVPPLHWVFSQPPSPAWLLSPPHTPHPSMFNPTLAQFEVSVADTSAGYLLALVCFPLLGAGLGAWGGLFAAGPSHRPGGGGGGGGRGPRPGPPPPNGGRRPGDDRHPAILRGYLHELPPREATRPTPEDEHAAPAQPGRIPTGVP
jgi:hypothetical protein